MVESFVHAVGKLQVNPLSEFKMEEVMESAFLNDIRWFNYALESKNNTIRKAYDVVTGYKTDWKAFDAMSKRNFLPSCSTLATGVKTLAFSRSHLKRKAYGLKCYS